MTKSTNLSPIAKGYHAVSLWVISNDTVKLLDFVTQAFDAKEIARIPKPDGSIGHAEFKINDTVILAFDSRAGWPPTPAFLRIYVEDGEAVYQRALAAGATPVTKMTRLAFGDQVGRICDPLGNIWWIQERLEETPDQEELMKRLQEPQALAAMEYVESSLNDFLKKQK